MVDGPVDGVPANLDIVSGDFADAGGDVVDGDVEFAVRQEVELCDVGGHGAADGREEVAVHPCARIVVPGVEKARQRASVGVVEALGAFLLRKPGSGRP